MKNRLDYFKRPIPQAEGFSPYRFPGPVVHLPVTVAFLLLGVYLCADFRLLYPLVVVYLIMGLYVGRDLAVYAHYNPLILLAMIVLLGLGCGFSRQIRDILVSFKSDLGDSGFVGLSVGLTVVAVVLFLLRVRHLSRPNE